MLFNTDRPRIPVRVDRFDLLLETVAAVTWGYALVHLAVSYGDLPNRIPIHFNASGQPDGWAERSSLFILAGAMTFLYAMLTGIGFLPPWHYNIPWKITEENAARQYRMVRRLLRILKVIMIALFLAIQEAIITIAMQGTGQLPVWLMPTFLSAIFGSIGWYFVKSYRAR